LTARDVAVRVRNDHLVPRHERQVERVDCNRGGPIVGGVDLFVNHELKDSRNPDDLVGRARDHDRLTAESELNEFAGSGDTAARCDGLCPDEIRTDFVGRFWEQGYGGRRCLALGLVLEPHRHGHEHLRLGQVGLDRQHRRVEHTALGREVTGVREFRVEGPNMDGDPERSAAVRRPCAVHGRRWNRNQNRDC